MNNQSGSCFCGEVKYKFNSDILNVVNCHCAMCRSHTGSAFSTYAIFPYSACEITHGKEKLSSIDAGAGKKHFCGNCGTPIFNLNSKFPGVCIVYFGTLDDSESVHPKINIWCESQMPWINSMSTIESMNQEIGSSNVAN